MIDGLVIRKSLDLSGVKHEQIHAVQPPLDSAAEAAPPKNDEVITKATNSLNIDGSIPLEQFIKQNTSHMLSRSRTFRRSPSH